MGCLFLFAAKAVQQVLRFAQDDKRRVHRLGEPGWEQRALAR